MPKNITIENKTYSAPTWNEMGEMTVKLAEKIKKENLEFDRVIAIARGGLGWARQLQDLLQIPHLSSLETSYYSGINKTKKEPKITQPLSVSIENERILVYDDVVDTGKTLGFVKEYLKKLKIKSVHVAAHFTKPNTRIKPDFFVQETDVWIVFPHDSLEMIGLLKKEWSHMEKGQILNNLKNIGIEESIINFAFSDKK